MAWNRNTQGKVVGKKTLQYGGGVVLTGLAVGGAIKLDKKTKVISKGVEKAAGATQRTVTSLFKGAGKVKDFAVELKNAASSGFRNASIPTPSPEKQKVIDTINRGTKKGVKGSKKITLTKSEASNIKLQQSKAGQQFLKNIEGGKKYMDSVRNPKLLSNPKQGAIDTVNRGTLKGKPGQGKITLTKAEAGIVKVNQSGLSQNILKNAVKGVDVKGKTLNMVSGGGVPTSNRLPASTKKIKYRDTIKSPKDRKIAGAISKGEKKIARIQSMNVGKNNPNLNKLSNKVLNETKKEVRKIQAKSDFRKSQAKPKVKIKAKLNAGALLNPAGIATDMIVQSDIQRNPGAYTQGIFGGTVGKKSIPGFIAQTQTGKKLKKKISGIKSRFKF